MNISKQDILSNVNVENTGHKVGELILNANIGLDFVGKPVYGCIIIPDDLDISESKVEYLNNLKNIKIKTYFGYLTEVNTLSNTPFKVTTRSGNIACSFIRPIEFTDIEADIFIEKLKKQCLSDNISWDDVKNQVKFH